jgi:hypothetical protein
MQERKRNKKEAAESVSKCRTVGSWYHYQTCMYAFSIHMRLSMVQWYVCKVYMHARTNERTAHAASTHARCCVRCVTGCCTARVAFLGELEEARGGLAYRYVLHVRVTIESRGWGGGLMSIWRVRVGVGPSVISR